jgi:hypothetical protein
MRESPSAAAQSKLTIRTRPRRMDHCVLRRDERNPRRTRRLSVSVIHHAADRRVTASGTRPDGV